MALSALERHDQGPPPVPGLRDGSHLIAGKSLLAYPAMEFAAEFGVT